MKKNTLEGEEGGKEGKEVGFEGVGNARLFHHIPTGKKRRSTYTS